MPIAAVLTRASPALGFAVSMSLYTRTSGPPVLSTTIAFIRLSQNGPATGIEPTILRIAARLTTCRLRTSESKSSLTGEKSPLRLEQLLNDQGQRGVPLASGVVLAGEDQGISAGCGARLDLDSEAHSAVRCRDWIASPQLEPGRQVRRRDRHVARKASGSTDVHGQGQPGWRRS